MTSKVLYEMIELVAQERNLVVEDVMDKVAVALKKACALEGFNGDIQIEYFPEKKKIRAIEYKYVVAEIDPEGPVGQILLEDAKLIKDRVRVGSTIRTEINIEKNIGRKGATQFKQLFTQGLKELGRKRAYEFFKERENEMITATVHRVLDDAYILGIGLDYDAYMPKKEALPTEVLKEGDEVKVYIVKVEETGKGPKVFVSRTNVGIVKRLSEKYESGGAGLFATNDEYMKVLDALANGGKAENGYQLLKPETIDILRKPTMSDSEVFNKVGYRYAHGVRVMTNKEVGQSLSPLGEFGWDGAAASYGMVDTENNISLVFTTHILGFGRCYSEIHPQLRNRVYIGLGIDK